MAVELFMQIKVLIIIMVNILLIYPLKTVILKTIMEMKTEAQLDCMIVMWKYSIQVSPITMLRQVGLLPLADVLEVQAI